MNKKYNVTGMTCAACQSNVERVVGRLEGVSEVNVNLLTGKMSLKLDETIQQESRIFEAVEKAGFGISAESDTSISEKQVRKDSTQALIDERQREARQIKRRLIWSVILMIPLMWLSMGHMVGLPMPSFLDGHANAITFIVFQMILSSIIMLINRQFFISGFKGLVHRAPNMNTLIALGSAAAFIFGIFALIRVGNGLAANDADLINRYLHQLYFESAAMILVFITVGKMLEARAKGKTSEALSGLMELVPQSALVLRGGERIEIDAADLRVGDHVVLLPGARVPCDGVVVEGNTSIDEQAMTGESIPVEKMIGDKVTSATMNGNGTIIFEATRTGDDTTLSQMIRLMEEASSSKAPVARLADRVAGIFVPVVMLIALITLIVWFMLGRPVELAFSMAISVLVISCPCALGLATPVAIMVATGKGARHGILIKSGEALEEAGSLTAVVFDKTGTLTVGLPEVTEIIVRDEQSEWSPDSMLALAASLEEMSEHPLAGAILRAAEVRELTERAKIGGFVAVPGRGIKGQLEDGRDVYVGSAKYMDELELNDPALSKAADELSSRGRTILFLATSEALIGFIAVIDQLKPTSASAVERLRALGLKVIMLTGDRETTAKAIGRELGDIEVISEVLPTDKAAVIDRLRDEGNLVAMVGDGINDAPALARSDVGMAIGAGSDIAIESADIVLVRNELNDAVTAVELSRKTLRIIKQNLFWAFFYNVVAIPLAAGVFYLPYGIRLTPMIGALAMSVSSIFVVLNALRLRAFKPRLSEGVLEPYSRGQSNDQTYSKEEAMDQTMNLKVEGMMCSHCTGSVEKALKALPGVTDASADLETKQVTVKTDGSVSRETLVETIVEAGYEVVG